MTWCNGVDSSDDVNDGDGNDVDEDGDNDDDEDDVDDVDDDAGTCWKITLYHEFFPLLDASMRSTRRISQLSFLGSLDDMNEDCVLVLLSSSGVVDWRCNLAFIHLIAFFTVCLNRR